MYPFPMKRSRLKSLLLVGLAAFSLPLSAQERLSLEQCRELAKTNSRALQQKDAERESAHLVDWNQPLGSLNFLIPDRLRSLGTIDLKNVWVANVTAIQPLFLGGKITTGYQMAGLAEKLQSELRHTTETEIETKVDETYWQVVSLDSKERLLRQLVALLEQTVKNVDASIAAGVATRADGLAVRTKLSEAEVKLSQVQNGLQLSKMLLGDLCGLEDTNDFSLADEGALELVIPAPSNDLPREDDLASAVERRSEVRSLRLVDSIYAKRVRLESADLLPKLYGFASYSATNPNSFNGPKKEFGGQYYLGVMLEVPISDLFSGSFKRRQAKADHRVKQLQLAEARSKISLQMKQALRTADDARRAYATALKAVEMARENMRYAEVGYKEGVIPLLNYTMAQTAWMSAQDSLIDAQIRVLLSESKLKNILAL